LFPVSELASVFPASRCEFCPCHETAPSCSASPLPLFSLSLLSSSSFVASCFSLHFCLFFLWQGDCCLRIDFVDLEDLSRGWRSMVQRHPRYHPQVWESIVDCGAELGLLWRVVQWSYSRVLSYVVVALWTLTAIDASLCSAK
jgi:hypothetical protein